MHIVDVSSPSREKQESAVTHVLQEMGVADKPRVTLWNKLDLLPEEEQVRFFVCFCFLFFSIHPSVVCTFCCS